MSHLLILHYEVTCVTTYCSLVVTWQRSTVLVEYSSKIPWSFGKFSQQHLSKCHRQNSSHLESSETFLASNLVSRMS